MGWEGHDQEGDVEAPHDSIRRSVDAEHATRVELLTAMADTTKRQNRRFLRRMDEPLRELAARMRAVVPDLSADEFAAVATWFKNKLGERSTDCLCEGGCPFCAPERELRAWIDAWRSTRPLPTHYRGKEIAGPEHAPSLLDLAYQAFARGLKHHDRSIPTNEASGGRKPTNKALVLRAFGEDLVLLHDVDRNLSDYLDDLCCKVGKDGFDVARANGTAIDAPWMESAGPTFLYLVDLALVDDGPGDWPGSREVALALKNHAPVTREAWKRFQNDELPWDPEGSTGEDPNEDRS